MFPLKVSGLWLQPPSPFRQHSFTASTFSTVASRRRFMPVRHFSALSDITQAFARGFNEGQP